MVLDGLFQASMERDYLLVPLRYFPRRSEFERGWLDRGELCSKDGGYGVYELLVG